MGNWKKIEKSVTVHAPKEKVWKILMNDEYTRQWYAAFGTGSDGAGAHADTDWQVGSKAIFADNDGSGMIATVAENIPDRLLIVAYTGLLSKGQEDYESESAKAIQGGREVYRLSGENDTTQLAIESDMSTEYFDYMSSAWDKALQQIKALAETAL